MSRLFGLRYDNGCFNVPLTLIDRDLGLRDLEVFRVNTGLSMRIDMCNRRFLDVLRFLGGCIGKVRRAPTASCSTRL